jgi:CRP/FNR family transcriptional regulator, cyclic AMP receptor protein
MQPLAMESILRILGRGIWFSRQPAHLQRLLVERGQVVSFAKDAWIFGESEEVTGLTAVLHGSIRGYAPLARGETVLVEVAGPGMWFGQISLLRGAKRLLTATAATQTQVLIVPRRDVHRLAKEHPVLWESFAELSLLQLQWVMAGLVEVVALPPRSRLAARLVALVSRSIRRDSAAAELRLTQADLAEMIGLERKAVHRILKAFEHERLVALDYGLVRILDRRGLERVRDAGEA